jgi:hypothetical protein
MMDLSDHNDPTVLSGRNGLEDNADRNGLSLLADRNGLEDNAGHKNPRVGRNRPEGPYPAASFLVARAHPAREGFQRTGHGILAPRARAKGRPWMPSSGHKNKPFVSCSCGAYLAVRIWRRSPKLVQQASARPTCTRIQLLTSELSKLQSAVSFGTSCRNWRGMVRFRALKPSGYTPVALSHENNNAHKHVYIYAF